MKREEQKQQSKLKIINAALEEFGQNDYFTASTNNICKNNGISKGLLFHYFTTKDEIFMECVKKCFDELSLYVEEHTNIDEKDVEKNLTNYMECRVKFFNKYPLYKKIFYTAVFNTPPHLIDQIEEARKKMNYINERLLSTLMDNLKLKENVNKEKTIKIIINFTNFMLSSHRTIENVEDNFIEEANKEVIQVIKMLFYGIARE